MFRLTINGHSLSCIYTISSMSLLCNILYVLKDSVECKSREISTESVNSCEEKLDNADNLMCMPNITELSWDVLQYGMLQKIPEKYTTDLFK